MRQIPWIGCVVAVMCLNGTVAFGSVPVPLQGLGDLSGGGFSSSASDVSADGTVVVGTSASASGGEAFRWTAATGMVGIGDLAGGAFSSTALGVSGDGTTVVGMGSSTNFPGAEPFRWRQGVGMLGLGGGNTTQPWNAAWDASYDGSVVVGIDPTPYEYPWPWEAFRWTTTCWIVGLGHLPGGGGEFRNSYASAVSPDGNIIVGGSSATGGTEAFRWTGTTGMVGLGDLSGGAHASSADAISSDGSVIVGHGTSSLGQEASIWTSDGNIIALGDLPGGGYESSASAVSGDGTIVLGTGQSALGTEGFIWDQQNGMRYLSDVLVDEWGVDLTGWTLLTPAGISDDGSVIVGTGTNPSGYSEAWIAIMPPPPLPGDVNGDGNADNLDITPFVFALTYPEHVFEAMYPYGEYWAADTNEDGNVDNLDITSFVDSLVAAAGQPIPEPATLFVMAAASLPVLLRRR